MITKDLCSYTTIILRHNKSLRDHGRAVVRAPYPVTPPEQVRGSGLDLSLSRGRRPVRTGCARAAVRTSRAGAGGRGWVPRPPPPPPRAGGRLAGRAGAWPRPA